jgi:hypothetical protein
MGCGMAEKSELATAPNPVMRLWNSCTRLKKQIVATGVFSLTGKIEGVQQDRSLTTS